MFATVEFYEREGTAKSRVKNFFVKPKIITEKVNLPENEYFYKLKVPVYKGRIPYDKIRKVASGVNDGLIFPEEFIPPETEGIKLYSAKYFKEMMLFNSALAMLEKSVFEPTQTVITLIDKKGVLAGEVSRLVKYAAEIRVVTDNIRPYEIVSRKILEQYGLSILVSSMLSSISREGIIISPKTSEIPLSFKGIVITSERRFLPFARVLTGTGISTDELYRSLCPLNIPESEFLSALCEVCFVGALRKTRYEKLVDISETNI